MSLVSAICLASMSVLASPQDEAPAKMRSFVRPVSVSNAPLAFFSHRGLLGTPHGVDNVDRMDGLYVFDPKTLGGPQLVYAIEGSTVGVLPYPVARPARDVLVVEQESRARVLDLATGTLTQLLPGENESEVIATEGADVFVLEHRSRDPRRSRLHRARFGSARDVERLTELTFEDLVFVEPDAFWLVTAADERRLVRVLRDGTVVESYPFRADWDASWCFVHLSEPSCYLAIEAIKTHRDADEGDARDLVAYDRTAGTLVLEREGIKTISFGGWEGFRRRLRLAWANDDQLWIRELPGTIDLATGAVTPDPNAFDEHIPNFSLRPSLPPRPDWTVGRWAFMGRKDQVGPWFEATFGSLRFRNLDEPIVDGADICEVSPDGRWAMISTTNPDRLELVEGPTRLRFTVIDGWVYDFTWLPAVGE
jgi:hypothetical protein